jgi:hypothetical protein
MMDKKTILLELPSDMIDRIDKENNVGDRSIFISDLLHAKLTEENKMIVTSNELTEFKSLASSRKTNSAFDGILRILNKQGKQIGVFNINNLQEFELLAKTIESISQDPKVKIRTRLWR